MKSKTVPCALLIFGSGLAALLYQTTWLREFRLIFGNSTAASAAVLGIFMGGLGVGSALFGKRAETTSRPLAFYAKLEFLIAFSASLTPLSIWLIRMIYVASGGTFAMGTVVGTLFRLVLAAIVLAAPTLMMGGTLPAIARFAVTDDDPTRRGLALLYGMNTLGAVAGAALGTFWLFERLGNHNTLYLACILNTVIASLAWLLSRSESSNQIDSTSHPSDTSAASRTPLPVVLAASALTGFVFLLMELVWYRMLSPILGGTAFTFGLILAIALLGIGFGGLLYSFTSGNRRPTLNGFATTCALEALFVMIPFALGDRVVVVAMLLQPLTNLGFSGSVLSWSAICSVVVLPVAIVAGFQFPMLIGLLGRGRKEIGVQTGRAYAWNTAGAIAGSLAGGFGFIPLLTAPGTWKLVAILLVACAILSAIADQRRSNRPLHALLPALVCVLVIAMLTLATGPTSAWRHSQLTLLKKHENAPNETRNLFQSLRRDILWEIDGIESSIGISKSQSLAFIVNGKSDGNARRDAGTQVMAGLLPALMHPQIKNAAVIGLGTGSTAGWLAAIPSIDRVDVVELEPVLTRFARQCTPVNHDALENPKLNLLIGDGRELLLTTKQQYDLVVSEPSNPYRAGIASLFTHEYYEAIAQKLRTGGLFAQWMQAYDMDLRTIQIFYSTVGSVFPHIETWQTQTGDLLLIASKDPVRYDMDTLRTKIGAEPFKTAMAKVWRTTNLEGVFGHYVGNEEFAHKVMQRPATSLNTDDRMLLEFAFARNRQTGHHLSFDEMRRDARSINADHPIARGELDWKNVDEQRLEMFLAYDHPPQPHTSMSEEQLTLVRALNQYAKGNLTGAWEQWILLRRQPRHPIEFLLVAECLADQGTDTAIPYLAQVEKIDGTESKALRSRLLWRQKRSNEAAKTMAEALTELRTNPWPIQSLIDRTMDLAADLAEEVKTDGTGLALYEALQKPFAVYNRDEARMMALIRVAVNIDHSPGGSHILTGIAATEPYVPWNWGFLKIRSTCYSVSKYPLADDAQTDLVDYLLAEPGGIENATVALQP